MYHTGFLFRKLCARLLFVKERHGNTDSLRVLNNLKKENGKKNKFTCISVSALG